MGGARRSTGGMIVGPEKSNKGASGVAHILPLLDAGAKEILRWNTRERDHDDAATH